MLKNATALLLIFALFLSLGACNSNSRDIPGDNATVQEDFDHNVTEASETAPAFDEASYGIDPQILYDDHGVIITATKLSLQRNVTHTAFYYTIQNDNAFDITVDTVCMIANGITVSGSKTHGSCNANSVRDDLWVHLETENLYPKGIELVKTLDIVFSITSEDGSLDIVTAAIPVRINGVTNIEQEYYSDGPVLYDEGGIRIVYSGLFSGINKPQLGTPRVCFYIENNTSEYISVKSFYDKINGIEIDSRQEGFSGSIAPGSKGYNICILYRTTVNDTELQYDEIETLDFGFEIGYPVGEHKGEYIMINDTSVYSIDTSHKLPR